jgi:hypothetical protein
VHTFRLVVAALLVAANAWLPTGVAVGAGPAPLLPGVSPLHGASALRGPSPHNGPAELGEGPHPADECWAEARYVPERSVLEVALRVDGLTLDTALSRYVGRDVRLEQPKGEVAARAYVAEALVVERRRACGGERRFERCPVSWIGYEFDGPDAWLYVEVHLPAEPADLRCSVELFFDLFATQRNDLTITGPRIERRHTFLWTSPAADLTYLLRPPAP